MKIYILIVISLTTSFNVFAQADSLKIDSLGKALLTEKADTNRVNTLNELANTLSQEDSILRFALEGLSLSKKLNYLKGEAESSLILGRMHLIEGNMPSAFQYVQKAIELFKKTGDDTKVLDGLNLYAALMTHQNNFREQLNIYFEARKIGLKLHDSDRLQMVLGNIGTTYKYFGKNDSAEIYYKKAYELSTKIKNDISRAGLLSSLGLLYLDEGRYGEATQALQQASSFSYLDNARYWIGEVYFGIAKLYSKNNNLDSSIYYANKSFETENGNPDSVSRIINAAQFLSELYEQKENYKEALHFHKLATKGKDSAYNGEKAQQLSSLLLKEKEKEQEIISAKKEFQNKLLIYMSLSIILIIAIIALFFYRNNKQQKKSNKKIEKAYSELKSTQAQLIQSEKMASLGELTAGIAHEIQNPLNFVNNFSEVNKELIDELKNENSIDEIKAIAEDIKQNSEKILFHGKRADSIVKGMMQHSQLNTGQKEPTNINALADEYLRLSYHGIRAKDKSFNATIKTDFDNSLGKVNIIPQDIGRVLLNLYNNAFYAVNEKAKLSDISYQPSVSVKTKSKENSVLITVSDNGNGIPQNIVDKIFQPFFTTKPTGQGTGLGLSLSYDIIKAHGGEIKVETKENEQTTFIVILPA